MHLRRLLRRFRWELIVLFICVGIILFAGLAHFPSQQGGIGVSWQGAATSARASTDLNCWWPPDYFACTMQGVDGSASQNLDQLWKLDFLLNTPPELTYAQSNTLVMNSWQLLVDAVNTILVLIILIGGFLVVYDGISGGTLHHSWHLLPRIVLAYLGVQISLLFCQWVIDLNNALADPFRATVKAGTLESIILSAATQGDVFVLMLDLVYIVVLLIFTGQMLYRLALITLLLIVSPLGMIAFALPQTHAWARWWINTFVVTTLAQFLQVVALALGATLMTAVSVEFGGVQMIFQLIWGLACFYLAIKIPSLLRSIGHAASGLTGELVGGAVAIAGLALVASGQVASGSATKSVSKPLESYKTTA
jgi:hypothetical protein